MHNDADLMPFSYEAAMPSPSKIPAPPDELLSHLRAHHVGLSRITIKICHGRKSYAQLNAISVGAAHGQTPAVTVDQLGRAIMAVCQDHYEEVDRHCKFMVQCYIHQKPTGDPTRRSVHFDLGQTEDGYDYTEMNSRSPEQLDEVLLRQINLSFDRIMEQSRIIESIGKASIENTGALFQARQEALDAQRAADLQILDYERGVTQERGKEARSNKIMGMLETAVSLGISQYVAAQGGVMPGVAAQAPVVVQQQPLPVSGTPAWAQGAIGAAGTPAAPAAVTTPSPTPSTTTTVAPHNPYTMVPPADTSPLAKGRNLWTSLTNEQWPKLNEILTKKQIRNLSALRTSQSDDDVLDAVALFRAALRDEQFFALQSAFTQAQLQLIIELALAASGRTPSEPSEPSE